MPFSEATKQRVKIRANFTCCWCQDQRQKVEAHHIIPQAEGGSDDEDNSAPLCSNCHTLFGGNPELRKEIRSRRDHWYEVCAKTLNPQYSWPIGFDVPFLRGPSSLDPQDIFPFGGLLLTDQGNEDDKKPPTLYLAVYFKASQYFWPDTSQSEKWLYLEANMRPALNLRIQVRAYDTSVVEVMKFLREDGDGWQLFGALPVIAERLYRPEDFYYPHASDQLLLWRENGERRLMISTYTATNAGISIHARLADEATEALADYLESTDFIS
jgi:hypothetical protein